MRVSAKIQNTYRPGLACTAGTEQSYCPAALVDEQAAPCADTLTLASGAPPAEIVPVRIDVHFHGARFATMMKRSR